MGKSYTDLLKDSGANCKAKIPGDWTLDKKLSDLRSALEGKKIIRKEYRIKSEEYTSKAKQKDDIIVKLADFKDEVIIVTNDHEKKIGYLPYLEPVLELLGQFNINIDDIL